MIAAENTKSFFENPWAIYILGIVMFIALFFIQKYIHLLDRMLSAKMKSTWEGTPWPLISSLGLGFLIFILGVFLPGDLNINPTNWHWPEIMIVILSLVLIVSLFIESTHNLGFQIGSLRFGIYLIICVIYFYAGLIAGLYFALLLAVAILIYFLFFWKKRLKIN